MSEKETNDLDPRIKEICHKLKQLRIQKGWSSYEAFALAHELSRQSYWKVEKGQNITLKTLFRLLDYHEVSLRDLLLKTENNQNGKHN